MPMWFQGQLSEALRGEELSLTQASPLDGHNLNPVTSEHQTESKGPSIESGPLLFKSVNIMKCSGRL